MASLQNHKVRRHFQLKFTLNSKKLKKVQKMQIKQEQQQKNSRESSPVISAKEQKDEPKPLKQEPMYETETKQPEEMVTSEVIYYFCAESNSCRISPSILQIFQRKFKAFDLHFNTFTNSVNWQL